jgi:alpha-tubulin suppressor-like RCC1 family protein
MKKLFLLLFLLPSIFLSAQSMDAGADVSLFICHDSVPEACGYNAQGQLGNGDTIDQTTPVNMSSLTNIVAVSAGGGLHSLLLDFSGIAWACGYNGFGALGNGSTTNSHIPVQVSGLTGIIQIANGGFHSLFLKNDGTVWGCGLNDAGQLGFGPSGPALTPILIPGINNVTAIASKYHTSVFLKSDSTVWGCGYQQYGQLGDASLNSVIPVAQITGLSGIVGIACGFNHILFLKADGTVWSIGHNWQGALGDGTTIDRHSPVQVHAVSNIVAIAAGNDFSLFLKDDATVWGTGGPYYDDTTQHGGIRTTPSQIPGLSNIQKISAGYDHSLFLRNDGVFIGGGQNQLGDLGPLGFNFPLPQIVGLCQFYIGIETISPSDFSVFPNPSDNGIVYIENNLGEEISCIEVYDLEGKQKMNSVIHSSEKVQLDLQHLSKGMYILQVHSSKGTVHKKLVIN